MGDYATINRKLKKIIGKNNGKIILFPYGKMGRKTEKILKENYGQTPLMVIDNGLADGVNYFRIEEVQGEFADDVTLFVVCNNWKMYDEIIEQAESIFPKDKIVDVFQKKNKIASIKRRIVHPRGKEAFLLSVKNDNHTTLLDVGCGNESVKYIKEIRPKIKYTGLDVGDYCQSETSIKMIDNYVIVKPDRFAEELEKMKDSFEVVISSHNIEHCNEPYRCVTAIANALKPGGRLYFSFPSEKSASLPSRGGTLNFYDDASHTWLPDFDWIVKELKRCNMSIEYASRTYSPIGLKLRGLRNERMSRKTNRVLDGTWALYGFESIIWAKKN